MLKKQISPKKTYRLERILLKGFTYKIVMKYLFQAIMKFKTKLIQVQQTER